MRMKIQAALFFYFYSLWICDFLIVDFLDISLVSGKIFAWTTFFLDQHHSPTAWTVNANNTERLVVMLRDGRSLYGYLRSYDQFANLVLQDVIERTFVSDGHGDVQQGCMLVRGENVVLLGAVVFVFYQDNIETNLRDVSKQSMAESEAYKQNRSKKQLILRKLGFSNDGLEHDLY